MEQFLFKKYFLILFMLTICCNTFAQAQMFIRMSRENEAQRRLLNLCSIEWLESATTEDVTSLLSGRHHLLFSWAKTLLASYCDGDYNTIFHIALVARVSPGVMRIILDFGANLDAENAFEITPRGLIEHHRNEEYRVVLNEYEEE